MGVNLREEFMTLGKAALGSEEGWASSYCASPPVGFDSAVGPQSSQFCVLQGLQYT